MPCLRAIRNVGMLKKDWLPWDYEWWGYKIIILLFSFNELFQRLSKNIQRARYEKFVIELAQVSKQRAYTRGASPPFSASAHYISLSWSLKEVSAFQLKYDSRCLPSALALIQLAALLFFLYFLTELSPLCSCSERTWLLYLYHPLTLSALFPSSGSSLTLDIAFLAQ